MAAESKIVMLFLATFVVVGALVPVAIADACTKECYKECQKGKKDDVPSCTNTCDGMCRVKAATRAYAAATPAAKAAMAEIFEKEATAAGSATAASTPGFATLNAGCLRECNINLCHQGKKDCAPRCGNICRAEAEGLASAATAYAKSPAAEKEAVIKAIDKHAPGPNDKVEAFAAACIGDCSKFCEKDPSCVAICDNGCRARSVSITFSLATPADKEAIKKDIQAVTGKSFGTA